MYSGSESSTTPIDTKFPEISYCGSGRNMFCTASFSKDSELRHLYLQHTEANEGWFVAGAEK